jgi:Ser/Thr protein kinase RdoA (MazF antagonist)
MERDWDVVVANWKDVYPDVFTDPRICHLGTRLRQSARNVSERLVERWPEHRTLIHGDFKTANLFFDGDADAMVALDWQWCGGGLGVMDLQYLLRTSCALEVVHALGNKIK